MKMRQTTALLMTVLLTMALAACKGEKKASTPTEAFKLFYEALKNKDVAALKSVISKETLAFIEAEAKTKNKSLDEYLAEESKSAPQNMPQIGEEKIDGDKATVQFKIDNAPNWSSFSFVKEDGSWKIKPR
jgi:hypothetical protein